MDMIVQWSWPFVMPLQWLVAGMALMVAVGIAYVPLRHDRPVLLPLWWRMISPLLVRILKKLDRLGRSRGDLIFRGGFTVVVMVFLSVALATGVERVDAALHLSGTLDFLVLLSTLQMGVIWRVMRMSVASSDEGIVNGVAAKALQATYGSASFQDGFAVRRLLIAHAAMALDKMVLLPLVGYLIFDLPGALAASTLAALVWQVRLHPPLTPFAEAVFALEKLLGAVPNYTAGLFLMLATFVAPRAGIGRALDALHPNKPLVAYESGGHPLAVVAWGLYLTLGGPVVLRDQTPINWAWFGPAGASAKVERAHIPLMLFWVMIATLILLVALMSASMWARTLG